MPYKDPVVRQEKARVYSEKYRTANPEKHLKAAQDYRARNLEKVREDNRQAKRRSREANPEQHRQALRDQYWKDPEKSRQKASGYQRRRRAEDPQYRLRQILRNRLGHALDGRAKNGSAVRDLGCSLPELIQYLEDMFEPGMTWENYGPQGWHIDHIIPLAFFDLTDRQQFLSAVHWTNLQPKWAGLNCSKGARIERPTLW